MASLPKTNKHPRQLKPILPIIDGTYKTDYNNFRFEDNGLCVEWLFFQATFIYDVFVSIEYKLICTRILKVS